MIYSLLEIVQLILSSMDSDEVNSISDTTESYQIAVMAKSVFNDICVDLNLPSQHLLFNLEASGDITKPVLMRMPSLNIRQMSSIKYDCVDTTLGETNSNYIDMTYIPFDDYIIRQTGYRNNTQNVGQMTVTSNGQSFNIMYLDNQFPRLYTTFDDNQILFDAYRADIDSTLVAAKTLCQGNQYQAFNLTDSFVPPLEPDQFSYFINKLKVRAWNELKSQENKEATAEARRLKIIEQKRKRRVPDVAEVYKVARYGRASSYGTYNQILQKWGRDST